MNSKDLITPRSRKEWAQRIAFLHTKTVSAIIAVGRALIEAKASLPIGEFGNMPKRDLPFSERTAQRYMQIASNPVLCDPSHVSHLPPSYSTLALLASWPEDELRDALERGVIHPDIERAEVNIHRDMLNKMKQAAVETAQLRQQQKPPQRGPELTIVNAEPVRSEPAAFRKPNGAAIAFESSKKNAADIAEADFEELKGTAPSAEAVPQKTFDAAPRDEDTPCLAALKAAWKRATATDQAAFIRWVEKKTA